MQDALAANVGSVPSGDGGALLRRALGAFPSRLLLPLLSTSFAPVHPVPIRRPRSSCGGWRWERMVHALPGGRVFRDVAHKREPVLRSCILILLPRAAG